MDAMAKQALGVGGDRKLLAVLEQLLAIDVLDMRAALTQACDWVGEAIHAEKIDVFLYEVATNTLAAMGTSETTLGRRQVALGLNRLPVANGGRTVGVFQTGEPFYTGRADQDSGVVIGVRQELGVCSLMAVPLDVRGERRGVLEAASTQRDAFSVDDLHFLDAVARWVGMVVHSTELVEQVTRNAVQQARRETAEELVTVLAHDLSNYLTPLVGRIDLLRRRAEREARPRDLEDAQAARAAVIRLRSLINDLMDVARLEQGIFVLAQQPLDLCALVHETVDTLRTPGATIEVLTPEELLVEADPARLRQALDNLLANALKHTPPEAPVVVKLDEETRADGRWAILAVHDGGPGIAPDLLPRLFTRFIAGPGSTGLGLGLYLAHGIAVAHGGNLMVQSTLGKGASFCLELPMAGVPAPGSR